jgi:hypothetical protein
MRNVKVAAAENHSIVPTFLVKAEKYLFEV